MEARGREGYVTAIFIPAAAPCYRCAGKEDPMDVANPRRAVIGNRGAAQCGSGSVLLTAAHCGT